MGGVQETFPSPCPTRYRLLDRRNLAVAVGVEPTSFRLTAGRLTVETTPQQSYSVFKSGPERWDRTILPHVISVVPCHQPASSGQTVRPLCYREAAAPVNDRQAHTIVDVTLKSKRPSPEGPGLAMTIMRPGL